MGVAATVAPKGLGPQDPTKKLAHWADLLGQALTRKLVFENFGPEPPLKPFVIMLPPRTTPASQNYSLIPLTTTYYP